MTRDVARRTNLRYLLSVTERNDQATEGKRQSSRALAQALGKLIALVLVVIAVILIERYCRVEVPPFCPGAKIVSVTATRRQR